MQARDVMTQPVVALTVSDTVKSAAALLAEHGFAAAPVVDDNRVLVGIVTEADLLRDAIPRDPRRHLRRDDMERGTPPAIVSEVMSKHVHTAAPDTDCSDIARTMLDHRLRSIPIVENRVVVGIVTRRDLVRSLARDDALIGADVRRNLDRYGGFDDWEVSVRDGEVVITGPGDNSIARRVARVVALATAGVRGVRVETGSTEQ